MSRNEGRREKVLTRNGPAAPALSSALFRLGVGEVGEPVPLEQGFIVPTVIRRLTAFQDVSEEVENKVAFDWLTQEKSRAKIELGPGFQGPTKTN